MVCFAKVVRSVAYQERGFTSAKKSFASRAHKDLPPQVSCQHSGLVLFESAEQNT